MRCSTTLGEYSDLHVHRIKADAIRAGCLDEYDVLIQPGGSGSRQGKTLGEEGREKIRAFVRNGGGYLGICAGAYLATRDYSWSLHILDARVVDKEHWARGTGDVDIALTAEGPRAPRRRAPSGPPSSISRGRSSPRATIPSSPTTTSSPASTARSPRRGTQPG